MALDLMFTRLSAFFGKKEDLYRLGVYYYEGKSVARDLTKARLYLQKASDKQYKKALYYLGLIEIEELEHSGSATALRFFELTKFYEPRANDEIKKLESLLFADKSNPEIADQLFKIGYMYAHDKIVFRNLQKAQKYFERSAILGNSYAQEALDEIKEMPTEKP